MDYGPVYHCVLNQVQFKFSFVQGKNHVSMSEFHQQLVFSGMCLITKLQCWSDLQLEAAYYAESTMQILHTLLTQKYYNRRFGMMFFIKWWSFISTMFIRICFQHNTWARWKYQIFVFDMNSCFQLFFWSAHSKNWSTLFARPPKFNCLK